jgi:hypothetical protein
MSDTTRPDELAASELTFPISEDAENIPVLSITPYKVDADKRISESGEFIRCSGMTNDPWPMLTGCRRGLRPEDGGVEPRSWPAGTMVYEVPWSGVVDILDYIPEPTLGMVGRPFAYRDADGNIYTFNIVVLQDGTLAVDWVNEPPTVENPSLVLRWQSIITGKSGVSGVTLDASGNIYLTWISAGVVFIQKYNSALSNLWGWFLAGANARHAATDGASLFTPSTSYVFKREAVGGGAGTPSTITTTGLSASIGVAVSGSVLFVASNDDGLIYRFNVDGTPGAPIGLFVGLTGLCVAAGKLYVLEAGAGKVHRFDAATATLEQTFVLGIGTADGQISANAEGIAVDDIGRVWIADTGNHRIQVLDSAGVFLTKFGDFGSGNGQFNLPRQASFGPNGKILYIADSGNGRVVILQEAEPTIELGYNAYDWDEEFIGGGTTSGAIGERGWIFSGNGNVAAQSSTSQNPGLIRTSTGGSSGNGNRVTLGPWILPQIDNMLFIFFPCSNGVATSVVQRAGIGGGANHFDKVTPTDGVCVEYADATDAGFLQVVKYVSGVRTGVITTVPFIAGAPYLAEFTVTAPGEVTVRLLQLLPLGNGVEQEVVVTGISQTAQMDAAFANRTQNGVSKTMDPDYWSGSFSGLSRA